MNILLLAPHPFYQDRGTPIAVDLILKVLSERKDQVHVMTYHGGKETSYEHVTVYRLSNIPFLQPFLQHIRPGFSWKKLACDILMFFEVIRLVSRNHYHLIHAVEESVFIAFVLKPLFKIPYVYDMDSSLPQQLIEKYPLLRYFSSFLNIFERLAVRNAESVVAVCEALTSTIAKYKPKRVLILQDVSLLNDMRHHAREDLRLKLGITAPMLMYVGNLEPYQGIDLLLESFALTLNQTDQADLVIIGGEAADIEKYQAKCDNLGVQRRVHFLGPKPLEHLAGYLSEADILVAPRITGNNTPMKLYSYLHSGKPVLATHLPTHTQVLNDHVAMLADPNPEAFSQAILQLLSDKTLRSKLGTAGKRLIEEKYTYSAFRAKLNGLYDRLRHELAQEHDHGRPS